MIKVIWTIVTWGTESEALRLVVGFRHSKALKEIRRRVTTAPADHRSRGDRGGNS